MGASILSRKKCCDQKDISLNGFEFLVQEVNYFDIVLSLGLDYLTTSLTRKNQKYHNSISI